MTEYFYQNLWTNPCAPKYFAGALTFGTTSGSKICFNLDIDHVSSIKERFTSMSPKVVAIEGPAVAKLPPEEAMFINLITVKSLVNASCAGELKVYFTLLVSHSLIYYMSRRLYHGIFFKYVCHILIVVYQHHKSIFMIH